MQPRPFDRDVDVFGFRDARQVDETLVQLKQSEQIDEVAFEKSPTAKIVELAPRETQCAQRADLLLDLFDVGRQRHVGIAALEPVFDLSAGKMMQHDLHHREFIKIGIEQRLDDHFKIGCAARFCDSFESRRWNRSVDVT